MDIRQISEKYTQIAAGLIESEKSLKHIRESEVTIVYLTSDHEKKSHGRIVGGQCEKIPDKYKWAIPCDFTITVFEPNVERLTDDQIKILLLHELMHIGIDVDGNEERYYIIPHDIEDFREIIERFGVNWFE